MYLFGSNSDDTNQTIQQMFGKGDQWTFMVTLARTLALSVACQSSCLPSFLRHHTEWPINVTDAFRRLRFVTSAAAENSHWDTIVYISILPIVYNIARTWNLCIPLLTINKTAVKNYFLDLMLVY